LGVPHRVTRDCLLDIGIWAEDFRSKRGQWGFQQIDWLRLAFNGSLFRLGRLQFIHSVYKNHFKVYQNKSSKQILAVSGPNIRYRADGLVDGTNDIKDPDAWTSSFDCTNGTITANPISCDSFTINTRVSLLEKEWDLLLQEGCGVLDVHIPAGEKLVHEDCISSYKQAMEFYTQYFPDQQFMGFTCTSWLLDPALAQILDAGSGIVRFQSDFYLMPVLSNDHQIFERVFGDKPEDLSKAPRDTSLRRAILDYLANGGQFRGSFGFIPVDEIGKTHNYFQREG